LKNTTLCEKAPDTARNQDPGVSAAVRRPCFRRTRRPDLAHLPPSSPTSDLGIRDVCSSASSAADDGKNFAMKQSVVDASGNRAVLRDFGVMPVARHGNSRFRSSPGTGALRSDGRPPGSQGLRHGFRSFGKLTLLHLFVAAKRLQGYGDGRIWNVRTCSCLGAARNDHRE
jgi:hypothetical protein